MHWKMRTFYSFTKNLVKEGRPQIDYLIKLDTVKEMAMLERNDRGKQVRRYFIRVEEKYKQEMIDRQELSPQTQALMALTESIARTEIQQRQMTER